VRAVVERAHGVHLHALKKDVSEHVGEHGDGADNVSASTL
jgi:hypothetical protein